MQGKQDNMQIESKENYQKSIAFLFGAISIFHLFSGLFQIHFLSVIGLGSGTGYDGIWYIYKATNLATEVDDYHFFRILPSYICYFTLDVFGIPKTWDNGITVFQYLNLFAIQGFIWLSLRLVRYLQLGFKGALIFSLLAFFNFNFTREAYYNPVMTDTLAALFSMGLLIAHLEGRVWLKFIWGILLMFTFPFGLMVNLVYSIFKPFKLVLEKSKFKIVIYVCIFLAYFIPSVFWYFYMGRVTIYTFPDSILPALFPVTLIVNGIAFTYFFSSLWRLFSPESHIIAIKQRAISYLWVFAILVYLIGNKTLVFLNNKPHMNEIRVFLGNYWTYLNLKPLIGLLDAIQFFGPIICLFLVNWNKIVKKSLDYGIKHHFILFAALFLIFLPEARHTLCLLPYLLLLAFMYFDFSQVRNSFVWLLGFAAIIISRYYYPLGLSEFPPNHLLFAKETDHAIYQQFPAQHFFMHSGITISHSVYLVFMIIALLITGLTWWLSRDIKLKVTDYDAAH